MSLFDMCCPRKPKKSLDYVIKWIEDADKTFSNINASIAGINSAISALQGDIKDLEDWKTTIESSIDDLVAEAIEDYDWSQLPVDALQAKADKVENAVAGHFAFLDANGNLVDSGKEPADFAEADHEHDYIANFNGYDNCGARVMVGEGHQGDGVISLMVKGNGQSSDSKTAEIDYYGIDNLNRALQNPVKSTDSTPIYDNNRLITSGAVKVALDAKQNVLTFDSFPIEDSTNPVTSGGVKAALDGKRQIRQDDPDTLDHAIVSATASDGDVYISLSVREDDDLKYVRVTHDNMPNLQRALEDPSSIPENAATKLITSKAVYDALANRAYAETLNTRKLQIGGIYLVKGTTLADYTIENISDASMQLYISGIAEIGRGRTDHLVIGLKDGATTYELLSTVHVGDSSHIALYIGDIAVEIIRNSAQDAWRLGGVTKISSLF